jgi:alanyl-tRNA synthetase
MKTSREIRQGFLNFFERERHEVVSSGPLVPSNDPTLMFANAGMVQFKDVFTGKDRRSYSRATTSQKCIRISGKHNDLENVGVTARHHTFFEMLGNFSFGDYFKEDAIRFAWRFVIDHLKLDPSRMVVTVFGGQAGYGAADEEAARIWRDVSGFDDARIIRCGADDNFWQMGDTGPCGPCTEIHYCLGEPNPDPRTFGQEPTPDGVGWFELWNLVFMQFERQPDRSLVPLPAPSVDTGAGLERLSVVAQDVLSNYDTDLLRPLVLLAGDIAGKAYTRSQSEDDMSMRVIADHARTAAFLISEGVFPDRDGRPYVLRRVMRRAIRHGHRLGIGELFLHRIADRVVEDMGDVYPQLVERRDLILDVTRSEEDRFRRTLSRGLELLDENEEWLESASGRKLPGAVAFKLYDTFGFPYDLQEVIGRERGFAVDHEGFDAELEAARKRSQGSKVGEAAVADAYPPLARELGLPEFTGYETEEAEAKILALLGEDGRVDVLSAGQEGELVLDRTPFYAEKGGQGGDRGVIRGPGFRFEVTDTQAPIAGFVVHRGRVVEGRAEAGVRVTATVDHEARSATRRNHSATHLLHYALRKVVGPTATQKGSLVSADRLRFDYSGTEPLRAEQVREIEDIVNAAVLENTEISTVVQSMDEAKSRGAIGIFEEKYGDVVRVLQIGPSLELCGGTHARRTGDIGAFTVLSDSGLAAGVRRIEAATGKNALAHFREAAGTLAEAASKLKTTPSELTRKLARLNEQQAELKREIERLKKSMMSGESTDLADLAVENDGVRFLGAVVSLGDPKALREMADQLRDRLSPAVVLLGSESKGKALLACSVSKEITGRHRAGDVVREAAAVVGGGGGGRPDFAQAGGPDPSKLDEAVKTVFPPA